MKTRDVEAKDLQQLSKLFDEYRCFYRQKSDLEGAKTFLTDRLKNKDSEIIVAENGDHQLMGFVQLYPLFSSTRMKRLWLLNDLYVNEHYRGQGISIALMNEAKELAVESNAAGLILETEKSNYIGNQLYPKMGFTLDVEHNYYSWST